MTRVLSTMTGLILIVLAFSLPKLAADEQEIALSDCPKAVQKTLKRESKGGKIEEVESEKEDGETIYEAEVILNGKEYEVEVAANGKLLSKTLESEDDGDDEDGDGDEDDEEEIEVKLSDCPKAVQKTLKRESKGGELEEITKETEGKRVVYEAEVEFGDDEYEVEVAAELAAFVLSPDMGTISVKHVLCRALSFVRRGAQPFFSTARSRKLSDSLIGLALRFTTAPRSFSEFLGFRPWFVDELSHFNDR